MDNRKFSFKDNQGKHYDLKYGVPQGSILGPLLFILYTNDMSNITVNNKVIVYADDTTVLITGRNLTEAKQHCNDILERFYLYFSLNKLSINPTKTKYIVYKPKLKSYENKKKLRDTTGTVIMMSDTKLQEVESIRFLGVIINNNLTWELHKKHIFTKVSRTIGLLYKCKHVMDEEGQIRMYKTFVQPYFNYAIEVWGHTIKAKGDILNKLQSKVLKIVFDCKRSEDAWRHNNGRIDPIPILYEKVLKRQCYKHHLDLLPATFSEEIMPQFNFSQMQNKITKSSLNSMYDYKKSTSGYIFKHNCSKIWNNQPLHQKSIPYCSEKHQAIRIMMSTIFK